MPLHFTAFHPDFKMTDVPATPPETLRRARAIARAAGLRYVYVGNVHDEDGQTTYLRALRAAADRARLVRDHALRAAGTAPARTAATPSRAASAPSRSPLRSGFRRLRVIAS